MSSMQVVIGTTALSTELKEHLCRFNPSAVYMDCTEAIEHYIDCHLYGSTYENFTKCPLEQIFFDLGIPTEYRLYIKNMVRRGTEELVDMAVGHEISIDCQYAIDWRVGGVGILEVFGVSNIRGNDANYS